MKLGSVGGSDGLLPRLHANAPANALSSSNGGSAHHPERAAAHPARAARLEDVLRSLLASLCHWLLVQVWERHPAALHDHRRQNFEHPLCLLTCAKRSLLSINGLCRGCLSMLTAVRGVLAQFAGLQDAVLAIASLRRVVSFALTPRCRAAVLGRLLPPGRNAATWDSIGYHVSDDARRLLLHGSLHGLAHGIEVSDALGVVMPIIAVSAVVCLCNWNDCWSDVRSRCSCDARFLQRVINRNGL